MENYTKVGVGVFVMKGQKVLLGKTKGVPQPLFETERMAVESIKTGNTFYDSK